jgi:hypothetical protein
MLGWNTPGLTPLSHNNLTDTVPGSQSNYFLNSIWMSGYGPSTASAGNVVYVVTSNSDMNSYGASNRDESVLKLSGDLSLTQSYFTDPGRANLDKNDSDLGAGGAMLSPAEPGLNPKLVFAAGKGGSMYMFDRSNGLELLNTYKIGACWCGPSYFTGSDGVGRVVSSGGSTAIVWRLNTSASAPATLTKGPSAKITSGQEGGFFTSVSSNGQQFGTAVVWAVGRPTAVPGSIPLYAIDPTSGRIIYTAVAGSWASGNSNSNTVPTVAGGHVYVATNKVMTIFGLGNPAKAVTKSALIAHSRSSPSGNQAFALEIGEHAVWGTIESVSQTEMVLRDRHGALIRVYLSSARAAGNLAEPVVGQAAFVIGKIAANGLLMAKNVEHAKQYESLWPADQ